MSHSSISSAAADGFRNEHQIVRSLNTGNTFASECFAGMKISDTASVEAIHIPHVLGANSDWSRLGLPENPTTDELARIRRHQKTDVRLRVSDGGTDAYVNLSLKKTSKANFNQVDRRDVRLYQEFWGFDDETCLWLRLFTGDVTEAEFSTWTNGLLADSKRRRLSFQNFPDEKKLKILYFLESHKRQIISDVVRGRGPLSVDFIMVTHQMGFKTRIHVCPIDAVIDHLSVGDAKESDKTSIRLGRLTLQRYGGSPKPERLQFKMKPQDLFEVEGLTLHEAG